MSQTIEVKIINSYKDLKNAEVGEFLKIQGRKELRIDTPAFVENNASLRKIYTLFKEKEYLFLHRYEREFKLKPLRKFGFLIEKDLPSWLPSYPENLEYKIKR